MGVARGLQERQLQPLRRALQPHPAHLPDQPSRRRVHRLLPGPVAARRGVRRRPVQGRVRPADQRAVRGVVHQRVQLVGRDRVLPQRPVRRPDPSRQEQPRAVGAGLPGLDGRARGRPPGPVDRPRLHQLDRPVQRRLPDRRDPAARRGAQPVPHLLRPRVLPLRRGVRARGRRAGRPGRGDEGRAGRHQGQPPGLAEPGRTAVRRRVRSTRRSPRSLRSPARSRARSRASAG